MGHDRNTRNSLYLLRWILHLGQWGTHCDPPNHFHEGLRSVSDITLKEQFLPLVVINCVSKVQNNPDYQITMDDVRDWEKRNGQIPSGSFVIMRTDWHTRWPDADAMANMDNSGTSHYPGWSQSVLTYLFEEVGITACGHETTDTDPGIATSQGIFDLESYILGLNKYQIELIDNTSVLPESGALIVVTWPKAKAGSGFPARLFAILPDRNSDDIHLCNNDSSKSTSTNSSATHLVVASGIIILLISLLI